MVANPRLRARARVGDRRRGRAGRLARVPRGGLRLVPERRDGHHAHDRFARPRLRAAGAAARDRPFRREGSPPLHARPERRQRTGDPLLLRARLRAGRRDARVRAQPRRRLRRRSAAGADRPRGDRARRPGAVAREPASGSRRSLLVLQHAGCEPPGVYEDVLRERAIPFERVLLGDGAGAARLAAPRRNRRDGRRDGRLRGAGAPLADRARSA